MSLSRRQFVLQTAAAAGLAICGCARGESTSQKKILVNQVGFVPAADKFCLIQGRSDLDFIVRDRDAKTVVHRGKFKFHAGDLGAYSVGDLSELRTPGEFEIVAADSVVASFRIDHHVYQSALEKTVAYFARQRCGDSKTGHHAPCHLDDGVRSDNHRHQDVTGGWHDACDLRKWVNATIYGTIGLLRLLESPVVQHRRTQILEELRWGNQYFLKMQEPDGYVMNYCGGDDGNRYTNNVIGDDDDRLVHVEECELAAQFHFVAVQASMARVFRSLDGDYANLCEAAARRCFRWCTQKRRAGAAISVSAAVLACVALYKLQENEQLRDSTEEFVSRLLALQADHDFSAHVPSTGFFLTSPENREPLRQIMHGNLPLIAICQAIRCFPSHPRASRWHQALERHLHFLHAMSQRSAFGIIPYGLYVGADPGGSRRFGDLWYRWFMKTTKEGPGDWWVGINAHLASNGVGLAMAGKIVASSAAKKLAQRQLDWIIGANPFGASTITGVGFNQPKLYETGVFSPPTPHINGGVMNGIGGDEDDEPQLRPGSWNTCEYWTPMVCYVMWLMAELQ